MNITTSKKINANCKKLILGLCSTFMLAGCSLSNKPEEKPAEPDVPDTPVTPETIDWYHYPLLDPTKNYPGIKEHYYNKKTKNFSYEKPTKKYNEATWTEKEKDIFFAMPQDERFIKSFNDLDAMFKNHDGKILFDNVYFLKAKKYYDENYSITAKQNYNGKLFEYLDYYENNFGEFISTTEISIDSDFDDYFEFSNEEDVAYGNLSVVNIKQDIDAEDISFTWKGAMIQPLNSKIESIGFAINSSVQSSLEISVVDESNETKFKETPYSANASWNSYNYKQNNETYSVLSSFVQNGDTYFKFVVKNGTPKDTVIKISSFVCKSPIVSAIKEVNALPSIKDFKPFDIYQFNLVKEKYASYTDEEKMIINYQKVLDLIEEWNKKYVLLYDMENALSAIGDSENINERNEFLKEYGVVKSASISKPTSHIYLENFNSVSKDVYLSSILMRAYSSEDALLKFVDLNNYGVNEKEIKLEANKWGEIEIEENFADLLQDKIPYSSNHFCIDFASTDSVDRFDIAQNKTNTAGYEFKISSLIGVKSFDPNKEFIRKIRRYFSTDNFNVEDFSKIDEIETEFNALSSEQKEHVTNINDFYRAKVEYNKKFNYIVSPDTELTCYQYREDGSGDVISITGNVKTKYGYATHMKIRDNLTSHQTWLTIPFDLEKPNIEYDGAVLYAKGLRSKLTFSVNSYSNYIAYQLPGESVGDGWLKFKLTKTQVKKLLDGEKTGFYRVDEGISEGTDLYISGLYATRSVESLSEKFDLVQADINQIKNENKVDEYSVQKYIKLQTAINELTSYEQSKLENTSYLDNLYSSWNKTYEKAYSFDVYNLGKAWTQETNISSEESEEYGKVYKATAISGSGIYLTLGISKTTSKYDGTSNQYRGEGKALKPLELGRYSKILFKFYNPGSVNCSLNLSGYKEGDENKKITSFTAEPGWNTYEIHSDELSKMCGYFEGNKFDFTSIRISIGDCGGSGEYKITQFIGTLDPTFTGENYHYPQDAIHKNTKNQTSSDIKLFEDGASMYTFVGPTNKLTKEPVSSLKTYLREMVGVNLNQIESTSFSPAGKYIYVDCYDILQSLNISDLPTLESLGNCGYFIKTIGNSIFIQSNSYDGYNLAIVRFLQEVLGFDRFSKDTAMCIKNGVELTKVFSVNLPSFDLVELPDFETRYGTNYVRYFDKEAISMGFNSASNIMMKCDEFTINSYHSLEQLLPLKDYPQFYWHDDSKTGWGESYEYQFCYTGKDYKYYDEAIEILSTKVVQLSRANPDLSRTIIGQWDCNGMCTCSSCKNIRNAHGGSNSSCIIKFMNDLDTRVKEKLPGKKIDLLFFAYHQSTKAPTNITDDLKLHDTLVPIIAPIRARWTKSFYQEENSTARYTNGKDSGLYYYYDNDFASIIRDWKDVSKRSFMWAYQTNFTNSLYFYNTMDAMVDQYKFFRECNIATMFNEGNWTDNGSGFIPLKDYIDSKLYIDLATPFDQVYEKFFKYYFRSASGPMKDLLQEMINNFNYLDKRYSKKNWYNPDDSNSNDFNGKISDNLEQAKYYNGKGNPYNGGNMSVGNNLCDISRWTALVNNALNLADTSLEKLHVKNEAIGVYVLQHNLFKNYTYDSDFVQYAYEVFAHYLSEADTKYDMEDGLNWKNGIRTICHKITGKTFAEYFGL